MATSVVPTDILSQRVWTVLGNQAAVNTYNYQCISITGGAVTDVDFANQVATDTFSFYGSLCSNQTSYRGFQVYFIRRASGTLPQPISNITGQGNATGGVDALPRNTAMMLKYNAFTRGPGGRGRIYLPFLPTDVMGPDGLPTAASQVLINSYCTILLTPVTVTSGGSTATFVWSLVKRKKGFPPTSEQIVVALGADKFGQMHKRGDYGRPNNSPL